MLFGLFVMNIRGVKARPLSPALALIIGGKVFKHKVSTLLCRSYLEETNGERSPLIDL